MRAESRAEVASITPLDELEGEHLSDVLAWIDSGAELCRIAKPSLPPKHLVSYFAVVDRKHVLLVAHKIAGLWLPTGGHVEPGVHPRAAVVREAREELAIDAQFMFERPLMVTCTEVGITARHVDVSLWYVLAGDRNAAVWYDNSEFDDARWFLFAEVPTNRSDPHIERFVQKLALMREQSAR